MLAELTSWGPAGERALQLGLAVLCGALVTAIPATILLVRARHRQARLRSQLARLTTSTALLTGTGRNGQPRRVGTGDPEEGPAGRTETAPATSHTSSSSETPRPPSPGVFPDPETVPDQPRPTARNEMPDRDDTTRTETTTGNGHPNEPPREPNNEPPRERNQEQNRTQHTSTENLDFGSQEIAERFRREYMEALDDSKNRLDQLRSRLSGELRTGEAEPSTNGHRPEN
ncbi:hypothetical protein FHR84_002980 [Actinopolyspora biskrensis]|uniref:Uncharacterized protein n=1 Tax=Actinopolyspora biskrensis TaxID=1470178 RepID=A0A852Z0Y5_9ACTN|nr:hypothetical protein [Actinopolyspora biskrensis]NYH79642.1 hypothetical protein [Actinopolyspora biskrensis]